VRGEPSLDAQMLQVGLDHRCAYANIRCFEVV
jgi:hypothetical protein